MKRIMGKKMLLMVAVGVLMAFNVHAATSGELLQQALYAEEIEGDLPAAIAGYEKIIADSDAPANHVAQALYRQGMCHLRLKQEDRALVALSRLVKDYSDQTALVDKARPVLETIGGFDPAALMPPETLAYLELGSMGRQFETILEMLKGTPLEDPVLAISQSNPEAMRSGAGPLVAGLLNPAMKEEFKKIRGLAIGLGDIGPRGPSVVAVLHLGESSMLRGLLMTALSMAGTPGGMVEGVQTYSIQGQVDIGCDDKVVLMSIPAGRLPGMIRQYKHLSGDASLARDNASFKQLDKATRQQNLATLWVNTDDLYTRFAQQVPSLPQEIRIAAGVANIASIDDLVLTASFATNAIALDGRIHFKEGMQNMIYEMIKTPSIRRDGMKGVPADAAGLLSFDLADSGSMQAAQLRQLAMSSLGVDVPAALFDSIEQVSLFALPYPEMAKREMPFRPGLVVCVKDRALAEQFVQSIRSMTDGMGLIVEVVDGAVLAALEPEVVAEAKAALAGKGSLNDGGVLNATVNQYVDAAEKLALIHVSEMVRWAGSEQLYVQPHPIMSAEMNRRLADAYEEMAAAFQSINLSVHTEEQANELRLQARLNGIPKGSVLVEAVRRKMQVESELNSEAQQMHLARLVPAKVTRTETAPVIDGERDEVWTQASVYKVEKTVSGIHDREQGVPISGCELAAEFRMLWDAGKLYVFMDVTDSTPNRNPQIGWQFSDNAILYIDANDTKPEQFWLTQYEYAFCWDATSPFMSEKKRGKMENIVYKIRTTETGYCIEAAFPWTTLDTTNPAAGTVIGIDVQVSDNQAGPQRNLVIGWQDDTNGAWQNPSLFGRAVLAGEKE